MVKGLLVLVAGFVVPLTGDPDPGPIPESAAPYPAPYDDTPTDTQPKNTTYGWHGFYIRRFSTVTYRGWREAKIPDAARGS